MDKSYIAKKIYALRSPTGVSARKMSLDLGLSNSYILQVESGEKTPSIEVLLKIADYFQMSLSEFFAEDTQPDPAETEILSVFRQLPDEKKEQLIRVARSL